jgi:hypothetical protein
MTRPNFTSINIILDRSGSMKKLASDTIGGFNQFLSDQKKVEGEAIFTLATFANDYTLVHDNTPLKHVADLTIETYQPAGYTALLDAIGRTINATGAKLATMAEEERPSQVLFVIMTDGEENSSEEFTRDAIFSMISHQKEKYNWLFTFIGASQEAIKGAQSYGIGASNAVLYDSHSAVGAMKSFASISANTTSYRRSKIADGGFNFFDQGNAKPLDPTPTGDTPAKK